MIDLEIRKDKNPFVYKSKSAYLKKTLPFVRNNKAVLIHRPRHAEIMSGHIVNKTPYFAISYHCGMGVTGRSDKLQFIEAPDVDEVVCLRCEESALKRSLPGSSEIVGRHVCIGKLKAIRVGCRCGSMDLCEGKT